VGNDPKAKARCVVGSRLADRFFLDRGGFDQLLDSDWKAANGDPGRVPHGIGDRARAGNADLADSFDAERVHMRVVPLDQNGLE
jgi:hypothetical protein